jgi:hypothetical protein
MLEYDVTYESVEMCDPSTTLGIALMSLYVTVMACLGYQQNIPCGATTPLGRSCRMGVPERGGCNKAVYCLNQLTAANSPIGRKHENVLQGTL